MGVYHHTWQLIFNLRFLSLCEPMLWFLLGLGLPYTHIYIYIYRYIYI
jgi:hypothetical protein